MKKEPTSASLIQELANNPEILLPDRPIAFNRAFVRLGIGVTGALFLSQALYWSKRTKDPEGWFYKTIEDWQEETGLTREEQLTIKKKLTNLGFLEVKKKGVPATNHFKIDQYSLALCMVKLDFYDDQSQGIPSTESTENQPPVAGNPDNLPITESTTESTSEGETSSPLLKIPGIIRGSEYQPDGISPRDVQAAKPRRERTPKQKAALPILLLMDYFRDEVKRLHNLSYLHREEDRNAKVRKQIDSGYSRFQEETRLFVDWWLNGGGAWCNYEPEACFTNRAYREYENRDVIAQQPTKAKGKGVTRI